jgi:hypothetical protein
MAVITNEGHYSLAAPSITLLSNGTIVITNIPDWWLAGFEPRPPGGFDLGRGTWSVQKHQEWWALSVGFKDTTQFASFSNKLEGFSAEMMLIGEKPPYKIYLIVGDPG